MCGTLGRKTSLDLYKQLDLCKTIIALNCCCWHHLAGNKLQYVPTLITCIYKAWTYVHILQLFSVLHFMCQQCAVPRMGLRREPFIESRKLGTQTFRTGDSR